MNLQQDDQKVRKRKKTVKTVMGYVPSNLAEIRLGEAPGECIEGQSKAHHSYTTTLNSNTTEISLDPRKTRPTVVT